MLQRDDLVFAQTLNALSKGMLSQSQMSLLRSRTVPSVESIPKGTIHLYRTNKDVNDRNDRIIALDPEKKIVFAADSLPEKIEASTRDYVFSEAKKAPLNKTRGLPYELKLSIGIKYMLTVNIDVEDGLVNGADGFLRDFNVDKDSSPTCLWIEFSDPAVGKKRQAASSCDKRKSWIKIERVKRGFRIIKRVEMVMRSQFPVVPAEALTICKSQ
ncbi:unnamed protein product [Bemisia tabaci]|uniref:ATP-dependent DNA helicase n=1 Tax=Bemisia tabaci TaxID=7038 RepID=A0A9P0F4C4_BEMTA|nr:unnamed protein product [Bemisia tabaci]